LIPPRDGVGWDTTEQLNGQISKLKRGMARLVRRAFARPEQYNVLEVIRDSQITDDTAKVNLNVDFWVTAENPEVQHLDITLELRKADGRWQITKAMGWQEAAEGMEEWGEL